MTAESTHTSEAADAAIEAGAIALYESNPSRIYDEAAGLITGTKPWEWMDPEYQDVKRAEARIAYEAMAPLIRAGQLLDFADHIGGPDLGVDLRHFSGVGALGMIESEARSMAENLEFAALER